MFLWVTIYTKNLKKKNHKKQKEFYWIKKEE